MFNIRKYLSTIFINIVIKDKICILESFSFKGEKLIKSYQRTYDIEEENSKIKNHLESLLNSHYFTYVSLFFTSIGQGVLPSNNKADLNKFGIDDSVITLKEFDNCYLYIANSELKDALEVLCGLKVDLIYSPFSILHKVINDKKKSGFTFSDNYIMFVLKYSEFITLMIYKKDKLKFASYFELKINKDNDAGSKELEIDDDIELDSVDDDLEELDFEELDNIKVDDNFNIDEAIEDESEEDNLDNFGLDMMMYDYINNAIKEFYSNPSYESDFITDIIIFEHEKSSKAMHTYIENELFIKPTIYKVDIFKEMLKVSSSDLGVKIDI